MRSQSILHDASLRSPRTKATTWRILQYIATYSQHLSSFLKKKGPISSSSKTSFSWAGSNVSSNAGLVSSCFEPWSKSLLADSEHAGNTSHAVAFMICTEYFFLFLFAPVRAKKKHCTFIAIFVTILLLPLSVMPVLHDVHAVTAVATTGDYFLHHRPMTTRHLSISHHRKMFDSALHFMELDSDNSIYVWNNYHI